jgi:asparagine synthase (glutamine-hydrolysing)
MCGIFSIINYTENVPYSLIEEEFMRGKRRGPEFSKLTKVSPECLFGFHRLAINGLNTESNQPLQYKHMTLICNGEIYNHKELFHLLGMQPKTDSDCEVILPLFEKYGIEGTLQLLDGVFSFLLCEYDIHDKGIRLYIARDPYGVRPLYQLVPKASNAQKVQNISRKMYGFASEMKMLIDIQQYNIIDKSLYTIEHFPPGHYQSFFFPFQLSSSWVIQKDIKYHTFGFTSILSSEKQTEYTSIQNIQQTLIDAIKKRVLNTDRPIACLLSGGLDSSLVTALVNEYRDYESGCPLETYSIGFKGSEDLIYANKVANYLGTKHTEIIITESEYVNAISEVIEAIESYDTTTVRASVGNYLISKWIAANSEAKVIFNGDGSDELCGGYLYMHKAPDALTFDAETRRLLTDIHLFDVLRSDKSISSNGLEPRTPFLDRTFVQTYLSIHPSIRYHPGKKHCEKYLLRKAFSPALFTNQKGMPLLPDEILWRRKEAFSDGIMVKQQTVSELIEAFSSTLFKLQEVENNIFKKESLLLKEGETYEKWYYRTLFTLFYPGMEHVVPYFWMPRFVEANDASARTLDIYKENIV